MTVYKRKTHTWPKRNQSERRIHPRVGIRFPIQVEVDPSQPLVTGMTVDLSLGGLRAKIDRYIELFSRLQIQMELPITERDGDVSMETVAATVAVVRVTPDTPGPEGTEYDVALAFTRSSPEQDRLLGTFLLQTLLFDPDARLI